MSKNNQEHRMTIPKDKLIEIYYNEYCNGISTVKLGKKYNIQPSYFSNWFKKLGLKTRSNKINSRKYFINDNYFENIDTKEKAYWLGFIYADGYVSIVNGKRIGLALSKKDENHIVKFNKCIDSTYPVHTYTTSEGSFKSDLEYSRVIISSDKMYDDLIKHGVVEHKTSILQPPNTVPYDLIKYFILGYFDGDGTIYLNNAKYPFYTVGFCGTDDILNFIIQYLIDNFIIDKRPKIYKRKEGQIVSYIKWGGNNITENILDFLYEDFDNNICLERKYKLYVNCKNRVFK